MPKDRSRKAALGAVPSGQKNAKASPFASPTGDKQARSVEEPTSYYSRKASWRIGRIRLADPYGWHELGLQQVEYISGKLSQFESMTWQEIFIEGKKFHHSIHVKDLPSKKARDWMQANMPDQPELWTLRFSNLERVWGVFSEGAYLIVFWDPIHEIYPSTKR